MTEYEKQLDHLIRLASNKATKEHSWYRAKELDQCETGMWAGIAEDLKRHMLAKQAAPARKKSGG